MGAFDSRQDYTFMRASSLEDMYTRANTTNVISNWTRDVVYLRPNLFVVNDRTGTTSSGVSQWTRWHFSGTPTKQADPSSGVSRYSFTKNSTYTGSASFLLPAGHTETPTSEILSGTKVSRVDVKPATASAQNQWLAVFDANGTASQAANATRLSAADGNVLQGAPPARSCSPVAPTTPL